MEPVDEKLCVYACPLCEQRHTGFRKALFCCFTVKEVEEALREELETWEK